MKDPAISWRRCALASALLLFIAALANNGRRDTTLTGAADAVEPACLATTNHTCAGHRDVGGAWWQPTRCLVCVWQKCDRFTGRGGCAPIEPLQIKEWRHDARNGDHRHFHTGDATDLRTVFNNRVVLKASWSTAAIAAKRKVYVDLGANLFASSIGNWFWASYPDAASYEVFAFEAEHLYDGSYANHSDVTLLHYVVGTANATAVPWGHLVKKGQRRHKQETVRSGFSLGSGRRLGHKAHAIEADGTRPSIDIADWLKRTVSTTDFVVVKMDIEGAEYEVIPHLLSTGAAALIDEIFVEVHTETNTCCQPPRDAGRHRPDAVRLLQSLRDEGVYAHEWL